MNKKTSKIDKQEDKSHHYSVLIPIIINCDGPEKTRKTWEKTWDLSEKKQTKFVVLL